MTKYIYYISWFTWLEDDVQTPWDFWYLKQGARHKPRKNSSTSFTDEEQIADAFTSAHAGKLDHLDNEFINDIKLLAFIEAETQQHAIQQVLNVFADAEFDRCEQVDQQTKNQIITMINQTLAYANKGQE